jgi:DNA repair protein RecO (recombination protein O)
MYQTVNCIALRTIKYDDRRSIVTAWSSQLGRLSIAVPAGKGREAQRRRALMMPLSLFEGEVDIRPGREIVSIQDVKPFVVTSSINNNPIKSVVALFLADVLERILRTNQSDKLLSQFIFESVEYFNSLESPTAIANFHLYFLYALGSYIGIEPDIQSWHKGAIFDLKEGVFRSSAPLHPQYLDPQKAEGIVLLSRMTRDNLAHIHLNKTERNEMLDRIIDYYTIHLTRLTPLPSLTIVREIF